MVYKELFLLDIFFLVFIKEFNWMYFKIKIFEIIFLFEKMLGDFKSV